MQKKKPYKDIYDLARQIQEQFKPLTNEEEQQTTKKSKPSGIMSKSDKE